MAHWQPTQTTIRALAEKYAAEDVSRPVDWREYLFAALPNNDQRYASEEGTLDILREIDFYNLEPVDAEED